MTELFVNYWQFFVAGIIVLALMIYWIIEIVLAKKAKARDLEALLLSAEEQPQEENAPAKEVNEQPTQEVVAEQPAEPAQETTQEPVAEVAEEPTEEVEPTEEAAQEVATTTPEKAKDISKNNYVIAYDKDEKEWVVKRQGSARASKRTKTKKEALEVVKKLTASQDVNFVVKKKDGKFQKK